MQKDRRGAARVEWYSPAIIYDRDGLFGRRCVVSNLSNGGARLIVAQPDFVPDECTLKITADSGLRRCYVVWRTDEALAIKFRNRRRARLAKKQ